MKCEVCGFVFLEGDRSDEREHKQHCKKVEKARKKYGSWLMTYDEQEKTKRQYNEVVDDGSVDMPSRIRAGWLLLRAYFSASVRNNSYQLNHIRFEDFSGAFLYTNSDIFPECVMKELVRLHPPLRRVRRRKAG